ncbi:MAG: TVP38/TMEM64 family protein [Proteobacteria bacterium]|nr:TVP38/TMEM64 family protein [Pseudomonadota bacterium]
MRRLKKALPLLVLVALGVLAWSLHLFDLFTFESLKAHQKALDAHLAQHWVLTLLIFMGIYCAAVALSLPIATFLTLTGGLLFGQWVGTSAVVISATLGACLVFLSTRLASKDLLDKKLGKRGAKLQKGFQDNALSYLLTLRLIPLFPFVVVNIAAAVFQMRFVPFVLGTFLGIIPGSFVYVSLGVALRTVLQKEGVTPKVALDPHVLLALAGLGVLSLLPVLYGRMRKK